MLAMLAVAATLVSFIATAYATTTCYFIHGAGKDEPGPPTPSYARLIRMISQHYIRQRREHMSHAV